MGEEKPKVIIIGNGSTKNFGVTDMQVYRNFETDEVFTIDNYKTDLGYKSGRENRRQRRKEQRKKK